MLQDPEKRAAYDQLGNNWQAGQQFRPPPDWDTGFEHRGTGQEQVDPAKFSEFFESLFGRANRGGPQSHTLEGFQSCGEDHHAKVLITVADAYLGARRTITLRSPEIDNTGHVFMKECSLNVQIPKGVSEGQKIRLAGQPAGDIIVVAQVVVSPVVNDKQRELYRQMAGQFDFNPRSHFGVIADE